VNKGVAGVRRGASNYPVLSKGSEGDLVVWAQEHLRGAGAHLGVTGYFGRKTRRAVKRFQRRRGLRADGVLGARTWRKLMKVKPDTIDWSSKGGGHRKLAPATSPAAPRSASLPAVRYEIPPTGRR
jgi:peptidoglycan hydrolase-like protein with peptidoglycan-binding domain